MSLAHVLAVLEPIWKTKTETASRVRGRMESVLDRAKGRGDRSGDNPAAWKGNLDAQAAFRQRMVEVVRAGRGISDLAREFGCNASSMHVGEGRRRP